MLKTNGDDKYATAKSQDFTDVCMVAGIQTLVKISREQKNIFARFSHVTFILGKYTNFKKFFPVVSMDFR